MAVVADTMLGNTRIIVHDDYFARTPEEVQKVLKEAGQAAGRIYQNAYRRAQERAEAATE